MPWNLKPASASLPEAIVVAARTSASCSTSCRAQLNFLLSQCLWRRYAWRLVFHACHSLRFDSSGSAPTSSGSDSLRSSSLSFILASIMFFIIAFSSSGRTFSGRPTRTTLTPLRTRPSAMLSTAMLHSEVTSSGLYFSVFTHIAMIRTDVCVFPVPGGPCTIVSLFVMEFTMASFWASETFFIVITSFVASSRNSAGTRPTSSSASALVFRLRSSSASACSFSRRFFSSSAAAAASSACRAASFAASRSSAASAMAAASSTAAAADSSVLHTVSSKGCNCLHSLTRSDGSPFTPLMLTMRSPTATMLAVFSWFHFCTTPALTNFTIRHPGPRSMPTPSASSLDLSTLTINVRFSSSSPSALPSMGSRASSAGAF
mmetsp:Transcript_12791/g.32865  ORF Transcript_12791/g.32865 Transcript_12791/m.32865 type:complete len:375 (-) Transcript_12791:575-1699(-)